jgi:myo-inositol-1(or 4)-monophosphatase
MESTRALRISREVAEEVERAINSLDIKERGKNVGMGKDGTPTKLIDRVAEDAALNVLTSEDVRIISEEAGIIGDGDTYVALDPLDGTFNASRSIPVYSISLCFSKTPELGGAFFGYVYNIATSDEYYADSKSYKNGELIKVSSEESVYCNAIVYYPWKEFPFKRMRVFGSAALEMCFLAEGSFDCFIDIRGGQRGMLRIYDVAAGIYIAEKAGATITDARGNSLENKKFDMEERLKIVAANDRLHRKILELIP